MQIDVILEVAIGLVVVWFVLSMATSQIQEIIADVGGRRSKFMRSQIEEMFQEHGKDKKPFTKQFFDNEIIESLKIQPTLWGERLDPADISSTIFAQVISALYPLHSKTDESKGMSEAATEKPTDKASANPLEQIRKSQNSTSSNLLDTSDNSTSHSTYPAALKSLISGSFTNIEEYKKNIQTWYEVKMNNAITTYRREVTRNSFIIGLVLAIAINGDSLYIANRLWVDPPLRQAIVAQAENLTPNDESGLQNTMTKIKELSLPLGWTPNAIPTDSWSWFLKGIGILLTALATAQGSPFWYDLLRRLISAKSDSGKPEGSTNPAPVG